MSEPVEAPYHPDELIVDLHHLDPVLDALARFDVAHADVDTNEALGLARLTGLHDGDEPVEVDDVLGQLRHRFASERGGWVPTVGKNRYVASVVGRRRKGTKPFAYDYPVPARADQLPPTAAEGTGHGVRVGIIDTPEPTGPVPDGSDLRLGHGAFVHGLVRRLAPGADVQLVGTLAGGRANSWDVAQAIVALAPQCDVLNLSIGCYHPPDGAPLVMSRALERIPDSTLVIAAAGNHGQLTDLATYRTPTAALWPAALPRAVAVGACDASGERERWSPDLPWVERLVLGLDVVSDYVTGRVAVEEGDLPFDGVATWSGTSFSAAILTGLVAARAAADASTVHEALAALGTDPITAPWGPGA